MEESELSTYERMMQDPKRRERFEEEYQRAVLVEILIPLLEETKISIRSLAKIAGISPTVIQEIKLGKKEGIAYSTFLSILEALGYKANLRITKVRRSKKSVQPRKVRSPIPRKRRPVGRR